MATFSGINVAYGPAERARLHDALYRRFATLAGDMSRIPEPSEDAYRQFLSACIAIESDEPTQITVLNMICHNIECEARGAPPAHQYKIRWYQRAFANICSLPPDRWERLSQPEGMATV